MPFQSWLTAGSLYPRPALLSLSSMLLLTLPSTHADGSLRQCYACSPLSRRHQLNEQLSYWTDRESVLSLGSACVPSMVYDELTDVLPLLVDMLFLVSRYISPSFLRSDVVFTFLLSGRPVFFAGCLAEPPVSRVFILILTLPTRQLIVSSSVEDAWTRTPTQQLGPSSPSTLLAPSRWSTSCTAMTVTSDLCHIQESPKWRTFPPFLLLQGRRRKLLM
jgi:hypothetical protein